MTDIPVSDIPAYTRKDFMSDQTVRWCPGCGDYSILAQVQKVLPDVGVRKEDIVFISGIGCSSRFPYYMNTYGIHSIHGRAPTLATGLKVARPELQVWVVTGDGDGLSIGGNHLLHACRRNVDIKILLFNNRIYGLTKGQYSPTSLPGHKTKSSPMGSIEQSFNPLAVTLGAEATFIARSLDTNTHHLEETLHAAAQHKGAAFVEILQNCVIFNDNAWAHVADKAVADDNSLFLEHGKPMVFGKNRDRGIWLDGMRPAVARLGDPHPSGRVFTEDDLLFHDETNPNLAYMIAQMEYPDFPIPFGVVYRVALPSYEEQVLAQVHQSQQKKGLGSLHDLYHADYTWTVTADARTTTTDTSEMPAVSPLDDQYMDVMSGETGDAVEKDEIHQSLQSDLIGSLLQEDHALISAGPEMPLSAAIELMQTANIGALLVLDDEEKPVGIFTEYDVLHKVATQIEDLSAHTISEFMTSEPDVLAADTPIAHALHLMSVHHYRHVPVVDERGVALDVISFRDVVHYIEAYFDTPM
jgi:2-oxoglutarate ferredoxin oxidoreductase subunit beta